MEQSNVQHHNAGQNSLDSKSREDFPATQNPIAARHSYILPLYPQQSRDTFISMSQPPVAPIDRNTSLQATYPGHDQFYGTPALAAQAQGLPYYPIHAHPSNRVGHPGHTYGAHEFSPTQVGLLNHGISPLPSVTGQQFCNPSVSGQGHHPSSLLQAHPPNQFFQPVQVGPADQANNAVQSSSPPNATRQPSQDGLTHLVGPEAMACAPAQLSSPHHVQPPMQIDHVNASIPGGLRRAPPLGNQASDQGQILKDCAEQIEELAQREATERQQKRLNHAGTERKYREKINNLINALFHALLGTGRASKLKVFHYDTDKKGTTKGWSRSKKCDVFHDAIAYIRQAESDIADLMAENESLRARLSAYEIVRQPAAA
ncbi:hypothetical protein PV08_06981 [Exophiala spinifera]|uniref:BHLH domain-containing protein n=1 Tax=Exophiala spinifera TaxID=91928 RepID=A0A0D2B676_9EURO|nr:uncharacterized protein PV08_06981 [Exophiala spinifera]KIW14200.1 hypothetical protein PV08_06981 [Exophiala spinifera]